MTVLGLGVCLGSNFLPAEESERVGQLSVRRVRERGRDGAGVLTLFQYGCRKDGRSKEGENDGVLHGERIDGTVDD